MQIIFNVPHAFYPGSSPVADARALDALLGCLINMNLGYLIDNPGTPALYRSGVFYKRTSWWEPIPAVIDRGFGDCKSLASWLIADYRIKRIPCKPQFRWYTNPNGTKDYHILVQTAHGYEDPSKVLGMSDKEVSKFIPNPLTGA